MSLRVYNSLTRQKEPFQPVQPGKVSIYLCGPTVYKSPHIGHMVGPVIFDAIKRYLLHAGYKVNWIVNITDVDDKLIVESNRRGMAMADLAAQMTEDVGQLLHNLRAVRELVPNRPLLNPPASYSVPRHALAVVIGPDHKAVNQHECICEIRVGITVRGRQFDDAAIRLLVTNGMLLDQQMSRSGELAELVRGMMAGRGIPGTARTAGNVDRLLKVSEAVVATSDGNVIDAADRIYDLPREIAKRRGIVPLFVCSSAEEIDNFETRA